MADPAAPSDGLEVAALPGVSPDVKVAPALALEVPFEAGAEPTDELPLELPVPPEAVLAAPSVGRAPDPPAPPDPTGNVPEAAAAAVEGGGGERLPDAGKCPPFDPSLRALFVADLRADALAAALLSAAAKSLLSVF